MTLFNLWPIQEGKIVALILFVLVFLITVYYMTGGRKPFVRRVPGLDAIEDAIGRSTEMGKSVVMSYGWCFGGFDYWTIAGLNILQYVSSICVKNDTKMVVPTGGSQGSFIVRPVAVDLVKTTFESQGKGELFDENNMPFLSGSQFAMGTGFCGILLKERPGSMILTGGSAADAMMVAEVSNQVGAITITSPTYISNVAALACASDYVLIGEETPAAGAYLSQDSAQLASLRTQDLLKFFSIAVVLIGSVLVVAGSNFFIQLLST